MQCNFQVGQKVVCIEADWGFWKSVAPGAYDGPDPVVGGIYTVHEMHFEGEDCWLQFDEFLGRPEFVAWHHESFRPLVTRKTDISVFTALLTHCKQTEPA